MSDLSLDELNPRYAAYCIAHGALSAAEMIARDKEMHPGGCMGGFITWLGPLWREWLEAQGRTEDSQKTETDHENFSDWLLVAALSRSKIGSVRFSRFRFMNGPWENATDPTIVRENPVGGDPRIIATLARVHNPDAIYSMIALANVDRADPSPDEARALREALEKTTRLLTEMWRYDILRGPLAGVVYERPHAEVMKEVEEYIARAALSSTGDKSE